MQAEFRTHSVGSKNKDKGPESMINMGFAIPFTEEDFHWFEKRHKHQMLVKMNEKIVFTATLTFTGAKPEEISEQKSSGTMNLFKLSTPYSPVLFDETRHVLSQTVELDMGPLQEEMDLQDPVDEPAPEEE